MTANELWLPPPELDISGWADEYRRISPEASAEPGRWLTDRAPYQREMLNAVCSCERVVIMTAAQVGKTEILLNTLGYYVDKEPSSILVIHPTLEMGEAFSKQRLVPMIRDTPCLNARIDLKARTSDNNILYKKFANSAQITIAGANSPASLASRPIRILLCDEVDRYPVSAGEEGDPLTLAMKRTTNFWNRRIIWVSTPSLKDIPGKDEKVSRITQAFQETTQEEWEVPCPGCGEYSPFEWERITYAGLTEPVMECPHCRKKFGGQEWKSGQVKGKWTAREPDAYVRGFHMNAFASPWVTWQEIADQYEEAYRGGENTFKVWVNTVLGLPYESRNEDAKLQEVSSRGEDYGAELPDDVLVLTCGIDTQDDRLEIEVVGWGLNHESWGIEYRVIYGTPGMPDVWAELDAFLSREWHYADGQALGISCTCIDSAGHFTDEVYRYVKGRSGRRIFAVVGRGRYGMPSVSKPNRNNRGKVPLFTLGVTTLKGMLFTNLRAPKGTGGYCHFPEGRGYDARYFKGLFSERAVISRKNGQDYVKYEVRHSSIRNEPLDCRVYAMGALEIFQPNMKARAKFRGKPGAGAKPEPEAAVSRGKRPIRPRSPGGFIFRGIRV